MLLTVSLLHWRQSDPVPTDPVPMPDPIPRPQPMPDPPPDEEPIKLSHRTLRSARIRAC
ncbi:proline-rich small protein YnaL [Enterobacter soli]|uniref:proline-rich small protein YnaL n=1 Tax=Enterobacter soli TaxID=885040 RepID=UPI0034CEC5AF